MRRLVPEVAELAMEQAYAGLVLPGPPAGRTRAAVSLGMVASVDGAVAVDGTSGALGGPADRVAFGRLRSGCDAILVGAGTVRAEDYGPPRASDARVATRRSLGLSPAPQLLVVTGEARLAPDARLFTGPRDAGVPPPIVITRAAAPAARVAALEEVAEVVRFGDASVDLAATLAWCHERGFRRVLCEGGPTLNGALLAAGLVDEVFLTVAATLVGGQAHRIISGPVERPVDLELVEAYEHDGELLLRYRLEPGRPADGGAGPRC